MPYRVLSIILIRFICQISLYVNVNCVFVRCEICYAILFYWMNCHNPKSMICGTVIKHLLASAQTAWIIFFFYVLLQICWGGISISDYKSIRKASSKPSVRITMYIVQMLQYDFHLFECISISKIIVHYWLTNLCAEQSFVWSIEVYGAQIWIQFQFLCTTFFP